ncbi:MAG: NADAR family protein [Dysgonomonas sp.]|nr:NADAR family protein [Dysgonomonas sp.]
MDVIQFYSVNDIYGEFSNFAYYDIQIDGEKWQTVEHYFQAQKFLDKSYQKKIKNAASPILAAQLGRDRKQKLRKDWESVKVSIMRDALFAKFTQHTELKELLLSTNDAKIIEHTENDSYWGDGGNGKGKNMLGRLLMRIRNEIGEK